MLSTDYTKGMWIGWFVEPMLGNTDIIPEDWTDSVELAHLTNYINGTVNRASVLNAINEVKKLNNVQDKGWNDDVKGLIAGFYFGNPNAERNRQWAEEAERIWDNDTKGNYGYYQEVCSEVRNKTKVL